MPPSAVPKVASSPANVGKATRFVPSAVDQNSLSSATKISSATAFFSMAPVLFQIMSDLHLETHPSYNYKFKQTAPYLALLGDIGMIGDYQLFHFLETQVKRYWAVFFLLGNHEPSKLGFEAAKTRMRAFESQIMDLRARSTIGRFVFLDQTRYDASNTLTILGCTLFSAIAPQQETAVASRLVDFRDIPQWTIQAHNLAHRSDLDWLNQQVLHITDEEPH
ncbi:hypothetical protein FQN55_000863 [Onygenales sp. PD_40]|nr:hypothetical protein FQN55_000863 [Onygenales sp. PD_40]